MLGSYIYFVGEMSPFSRTFEIRGGEVKNLRVDERNMALTLREAIWLAKNKKPDEERPQGTKGVYIHDNLNLPNVLSLISKVSFCHSQAEISKTHLFVLLEDGKPLAEVVHDEMIQSQLNCKSNVVLVVGDENGFSKSDEELLRISSIIVSLGPIPVLASQAVTLAHNTFDCVLFNKLKEEQ